MEGSELGAKDGGSEGRPLGFRDGAMVGCGVERSRRGTGLPGPRLPPGLSRAIVLRYPSEPMTSVVKDSSAAASCARAHTALPDEEPLHFAGIVRLTYAKSLHSENMSSSMSSSMASPAPAADPSTSPVVSSSDPGPACGCFRPRRSRRPTLHGSFVSFVIGSARFPEPSVRHVEAPEGTLKVQGLGDRARTTRSSSTARSKLGYEHHGALYDSPKAHVEVHRRRHGGSRGWATLRRDWRRHGARIEATPVLPKALALRVAAHHDGTRVLPQLRAAAESCAHAIIFFSNFYL